MLPTQGNVHYFPMGIAVNQSFSKIKVTLKIHLLYVL